MREHKCAEEDIESKRKKYQNHRKYARSLGIQLQRRQWNAEVPSGHYRGGGDVEGNT
jgi:hypothetical protein